MNFAQSTILVVEAIVEIAGQIGMKAILLEVHGMLFQSC